MSTQESGVRGQESGVRSQESEGNEQASEQEMLCRMRKMLTAMMKIKKDGPADEGPSEEETPDENSDEALDETPEDPKALRDFSFGGLRKILALLRLGQRKIQVMALEQAYKDLMAKLVFFQRHSEDRIDDRIDDRIENPIEDRIQDKSQDQIQDRPGHGSFSIAPVSGLRVLDWLLQHIRKQESRLFATIKAGVRSLHPSTHPQDVTLSEQLTIILATPLQNVPFNPPLPVRAQGAFQKLHLQTLYDLLITPPEQLLSLPNCGHVTVIAIQNSLHNLTTQNFLPKDLLSTAIEHYPNLFPILHPIPLITPSKLYRKKRNPLNAKSSQEPEKVSSPTQETTYVENDPNMTNETQNVV